MKRVLTILGTRPEAIKLAPIIRELGLRSGTFESSVCLTGQHRELLDPMLDFFEVKPHYDLQLMRANQTLSGLTARLLEALDPLLEKVRPDWVIVQGDTTTVMAGALAAFYRGVRIAHVEAGLRTGDLRSPFPEEANRKLASVLADVHFAPTERAVRNLVREDVPEKQICLSGNTVVDALKWASGLIEKTPPPWPVAIPAVGNDQRLILVTGHRRENFGEGLDNICAALVEIANKLTDCTIVYPVHLNPRVRETVYRLIGAHPRIHLIAPVEYPILVSLLKRAWLVLTDSGGIQEEAPAFGVPCLVMRDTTERPEGIEQGVAKLVGTNRSAIMAEVQRLNNDQDAYRSMAKGGNPYGDGRAAKRIVDWLEVYE